MSLHPEAIGSVPEETARIARAVFPGDNVYLRLRGTVNLRLVPLDQQFARREPPPLVAGPPGLRSRLFEAMEVLFPGSTGVRRRFDLDVVVLPEQIPTVVGLVEVRAIPVVHASLRASTPVR